MCSCCCCKIKTLSTCGWVFTLISGLLGITCVILAAITYETTQFDWASGTKYQSLGVITIVAVCVVLVAMIFGFVQFCNCAGKCCYGVFFLIIQAVCALFLLGISIFGLVSGTMGKIEDYVGCNTDYKGILSFWKNMDHLLTLIDIGLCSTECPCDITEEAQKTFTDSTEAKPYFEKWTITDGGAESFNNCSKEMNSFVQTAFMDHDEAGGDHIGEFNITKFSDYWSNIEEKFKCTGFCKQTYEEELIYYKDTGKIKYTGGFYKYLFSGVNKGLVENVGCLKSILEWLSPILLSYGIIAFICSLLSIWTWLLGLFLLCHCYKKEEKDDKDKK